MSLMILDHARSGLGIQMRPHPANSLAAAPAKPPPALAASATNPAVQNALWLFLPMPAQTSSSVLRQSPNSPMELAVPPTSPLLPRWPSPQSSESLAEQTC